MSMPPPPGNDSGQYPGHGQEQYPPQYGQGQGPQHPPGYGPRNGMGIAALILGIVGLLFCIVPFTAWIGIILGIVGTILGAVGISRARKRIATNLTMSIIGTVLSVLAIIAGIASLAVLFNAVDSAVKDLDEKISGTTPLTYEVESSSGTATVTYDGGEASGGSSFNNDVDTPWSKDVEASNFLGGYLSASAGAEGGSVTCRVLDDTGEVLVENTADGQFASAHCRPGDYQD